MSSSWGHQPAQNPATRRNSRWVIAVILLIVLILLLVFAPGVLALLSVPAFFIALIALIIGRLRWARIPNRRVAGALLGGIFVLLFVSTGIANSRLPATTADRDPVATTPSPTATVEAPPVTLIGQTCDTDDLVETEDAENIHCDDDGTGSLRWVSAADHEEAERQAAADKAAAEKKAAEKKAAEKAAEKAAAEKAAAEKKAAEKEAAEQAAAEKKAAEEKAAAQKAAANKAAAEKKAADKAAAEKAAAQKAAANKAAAEKRAAEQAAAEKAATPKYQAPAPKSGGTDPRFPTCAKAIAAGYGPYVSGVNPEYNWYRDSDKDGVNCER